MRFASHARNFEYVVLRRALEHPAPGFHIDGGATLPRAESATKAFRVPGRSGIHMEPATEPSAIGDQAHPNDANLRPGCRRETTTIATSPVHESAALDVFELATANSQHHFRIPGNVCNAFEWATEVNMPNRAQFVGRTCTDAMEAVEETRLLPTHEPD